MDIIPTWLILVLIVALLALAGGLTFWLYYYITAKGQSNSQPASSSITPSPTQKSSGGGPSEEQELLRVCRTPKGDIVIFVLGQRYSHLREIKDKRVGGEAIAAIKAITLFAKGWLPALRKDEQEEHIGAESTVDPETFLKQLQSADLFPRETSRPSGLFSRNRPSVSSAPVKPLSTPADEINQLIEEQVGRYPQMQKHHIHLTTNLDGSLCFHVGLHTFSSPEEITDAQVRAFVQDTIRKWKQM
ncbi:MAG TPA: hypothetical protein ENN19_06395 [Chloroflexi bacterium]|nr:hypothetical protein [Chloroflexota bacterium]